MDIKDLTKRQVRYWCHRFKIESAGGVSADEAPEGLKDYFESHEYFLGWDKFNESLGWDVNKQSPLEIIPLRLGTDELWNRELRNNSREIKPGKNKQKPYEVESKEDKLEKNKLKKNK